MYIQVHNQAVLMIVGVAKDLPYPILLSTDLPILPDLDRDSITKSGAREVSKATDTPATDADIVQLMPYHSKEVVGEPYTHTGREV